MEDPWVAGVHRDGCESGAGSIGGQDRVVQNWVEFDRTAQICQRNVEARGGAENESVACRGVWQPPPPWQ